MLFSIFLFAIANAYLSFDLNPLVKESQTWDKRDNIQADLFNEQIYYTVDFQVGSNKQNVSLVVDTRLGLMWFPAAGCSGGSSKRDTLDDFYNCESKGTYNPEDLDTFKNESISVVADFGGIGLSGYSANDTLILDDDSFEMSFVVATRSDSVGMLGLGYPSSVYVTEGEKYRYHGSFIRTLWLDDLIQSESYSIRLGPNRADKGQLLLGAVDHSKYTGTLGVVHMTTPYTGTYRVGDILIIVDRFLGDGFSIPVQLPAIILLSSRVLLFPYEYVKELGEKLGAVEESRSSHRLDCGLLNLTSLISLYFSGVEIQVPIRDLVWQEKNACYLSFNVANGPSIIGQDILRSIYLVINLARDQVGLGQASLADNPGRIEEISFNIPGAATATQYSYTLARERYSEDSSGRWSTYSNSVPTGPSYLINTSSRSVDLGNVVYLLTVSEESSGITSSSETAGNSRAESSTQGHSSLSEDSLKTGIVSTASESSISSFLNGDRKVYLTFLVFVMMILSIV